MNSRWDAATADFAPLHETSTHWSLIQKAQQGDPDSARAALHQLILQYVPPLQRYVQGPPWRFDAHAAQDLIQGFVETRLLAGRLVAQSDPTRGHFRGYLKTALDNFIRDRLRSPGQTPRPWGRGTTDDDSRAGDFSGEASAFDPFDVAWARGLLYSVITQLEQSCAERGQTAVWTVFEARLLRPILQQTEPVAYEDLAEQCHFDTPKAAANALITAKRVFRKLFEDAIAVYAQEDAERQEELRLIRSIFAEGVTLTESATAESQLNESCRLAEMLDLPRGQRGWSALELEAILEQQLSLPATDFGVSPRSPSDGLTLLSLLTTSPTIPECLQIKQWAKSQASSPAPAIPRDVATALYFAALSAARVTGQARITRLPDRVLAVSLGELLAQSWISTELRRLYDACRHTVTATVPS